MEIEGFERLTMLGRGGTATVYSATRTTDLSPLVVKVFDPDQHAAFDRQLAAADRLGAIDGVLNVVGQGRLDDGRPYLVTPFAPGGSLSDHIGRFGAMAPERVAGFGATLAHALAGAHAAGVLHRDLKPSNVLLDERGEPVIGDFGAATEIDTGTASATVVLTTMYAAPEVLEGSSADERSDVYSLGLTLLALAIGRSPFPDPGDGGLAALVNRICSDGAPDPGGEDLPDGLAAVLRTATAVDPGDRFPSAVRFAAALEAVREHPDEVPTGSARRRRLSAREASRRRSWRLVGGAVVLVAIVVGVAFWVSAAREQDRLDARQASIESAGEPATAANGIMGPLYQQDDITYVGLLDDECEPDDRLAELSIHAGPDDTLAGVDTPWEAVSGEGVGVFMSYMPCDSGIAEARFKLGASGRWFVFVARFPQDQYETMVADMRNNETSPSPDFTVDEDVLATLADQDVYEGWAMIDRPA